MGEYKLELKGINYLILVPKNQLFKCMLEGTDKSVVVKHEIKYSKNKSTYLADTNIALVKNVYDYDWVFASNMLLDAPLMYVKIYRQRWNIETMFRVHDEAKIMSKSVNPLIRLFYFMISLLLLLIWNLYAKLICTFKKFIILIEEISSDVTVSFAD
ncbi:MAG: hypothetical protein FD167_4589 [bacterium]|nr:MAG: hypothetical protein FD167_4589 [bacterium]